MSGTNALAPNLNALMSAQAAPAPAATAAAAPQGITPDQVGHLVSGAMRGSSHDTVIRKRDAAGPELEMLSRVMNDPDPKPDEVHDYMFGLIKSGQIPARDALQIIQSMPKDPDMLRTWAHAMFGLVMHQGAHAHAAFPRESFPSATPEGATPEEEQPS